MKFYINYPDHPWARSRDGNFFLDIIIRYSYANNIVANDIVINNNRICESTNLPMWWFGA